MASYSDNFNRTTLGSGWATLNGGAWGIDASTYLTQEQTTGTYRVLRYESTFDSDDIDVTMEVYSPGTNTGAGIIARLPNTGTATADIDGYGLVFFPGDTFYLLRFDSGDDSGVGYGYTWGSPTTNTYYTLRLTVQGSTVTGYVDGTQRFQFTDATYSGSGNRRVGAVSYGSVSNSNGARYDNFVALDIVSSQSITPNLHTNTNTFYAPTVSLDTGAQNITANLLTNSNTFYSPVLVQNQIVQPNVVRRTNRSIKFNGNGADVNRIRIPLEDGVSTQYPINVGATHFTTEAWIRANYSENTTTATDEDARYSNIIYDRDSWGEQRGHVWGVTRSGSNLIACFGQAGSGGSWNTIFTTSNIGDGEWHHIAVTRNQTTGVVRIWIDGVQEASGTYDTTNWSFPAGHTVGSGQDNEYLVLGTEKHDVGYYYTGEIDEFRVSNEVKYTSAFTPSRQLPIDDGVVGLYRCDEGSGTVFFDETLNTNGELLVGGSPSGPTWINLEDSYNLFFAPTVAVGEITLLPNLLENTNSLYEPTITTGAVGVSPNLLANTNSFYVPTISVGSVDVQPNLLENSNVLHEPTLNVGAVTVSPNVLVNTSSVQEPTVNVGAVTVSPNVLTNTSIFYNPTVSSGYVVAPEILENVNVVHEPTIIPGSVSISANTLENTTVFYNPTVSSGYTISTDLLENTNTVHQPTINVGAVTVTTNTLTNTTIFYNLIVNAGGTIIQPDILENSNVIHEPTINVGSVNVQPELLDNTNTIYSPTVNPGSITVQTNILNNNIVIYEPVVSSGGITVVPDVLNNSNTIYDIIVSAGAVNVSLNSLENTNTFYGPTVVQNVTTDLLESTNVIHEASVVQVISTQLLNNTNSLYSPTITTGAVNIETVRVESATVIYEPQVQFSGNTTLTMNLLTNTQQFFSPVLVERHSRINRISSLSRIKESFNTVRTNYVLGTSRATQDAYSGLQNISINSLINNGALYQPTINVGGVDVLLSTLINQNQIQVPVISTGAVDINTNLIVGSNVLYQPEFSVEENSWWLAGGVNAANCVAAYQPKGAASLSVSYTNLANPGTYNAAPGIAPTFDTATGWTFDAASSQYLTTGITPASGYSMIVRFSDMSNANAIIGQFTTNARFFISPNQSGIVVYGSGQFVTTSPGITGGVLAIAGQQGYKNGTADGAIIGAWTTTASFPIILGGRNLVPINYGAGKIQAAAIYNATLTAPQVAAISAAMADL